MAWHTIVREVQIANMMNQGREESVGSRDVNVLADLEKQAPACFGSQMPKQLDKILILAKRGKWDRAGWRDPLQGSRINQCLGNPEQHLSLSKPRLKAYFFTTLPTFDSKGPFLQGLRPVLSMGIIFSIDKNRKSIFGVLQPLA